MRNQTLKITMNKLHFIKNGDSPGKSEIYYTLMADDQIIDSLDKNQARKTGDGDTIILGNSSTVTKSASASLTVLGNVSDDDGGLKGNDDTGAFKHVRIGNSNGLFPRPPLPACDPAVGAACPDERRASAPGPRRRHGQDGCTASAAAEGARRRDAEGISARFFLWTFREREGSRHQAGCYTDQRRAQLGGPSGSASIAMPQA